MGANTRKHKQYLRMCDLKISHSLIWFFDVYMTLREDKTPVDKLELLCTHIWWFTIDTAGLTWRHHRCTHTAALLPQVSTMDSSAHIVLGSIHWACRARAGWGSKTCLSGGIRQCDFWEGWRKRPPARRYPQAPSPFASRPTCRLHTRGPAAGGMNGSIWYAINQCFTSFSFSTSYREPCDKSRSVGCVCNRCVVPQ